MFMIESIPRRPTLRDVGETSLPVVDVTAFASGLDHDSPAAASAAERIDAVFRELGFLLVTGHGIDDGVKQRMLDQLRVFFALPVEQKEAIAIGRSPCHRGYVGIATETLDDANTLAGDLKETIDSGPEHGPDHPEVVAGTPLHGPNQLPDLPGFRAAWEEYFEQAVEAAVRVQRGVAMALGLPVDYLLDIPGETLYHFRMIHYPPQYRLPPTEGQLGCGAHTDYGSVTLLTDDGVGGLQVMRRDGTWIDVQVPDDHVVVNLGDLMAIWTNDRYVSNPHRVINPPDVDRYSMPLFVTPPFHARIECLETCLEPGQSPRYEAMVAGPYLLSRFDNTHSYRNEILDAHNRAVADAVR
jgi:isopenicillin N synthase-like dioxygenase